MHVDSSTAARLRTRALLCAALLLAACETTHYEFHPPASEAGRLCLTQCGGVREACRNTEMQRAEWEKASCERHQESTYRACLAHADNKDEKKACAKRRTSCYASENTWRCDEDYRQCYVNCGGHIRTYTE